MLNKLMLSAVMIFSLAATVVVAAPEGPMPCDPCFRMAAPEGPMPCDPCFSAAAPEGPMPCDPCIR